MKIQISCAVAFAAALLCAAEGQTGTVNANILNVRNRPDGANSTVVAKLKQGDSVKVVKQSGEWLEIVAPADTAVYLHTKFLSQGKTTREVNLRAGAGVEYQSYGIIPGGTAVQTVGEAKNEWIRIVPLTTMTCFVSSKFVTLGDKAAAVAPSAVAGESGKNAPAAGTSAAVKPGNPVAAAPGGAAVSDDLAKLRLLFVTDSAKPVVAEGVLCGVKSHLNCITAALATPGKDRQVIYYLYGADREIAALLGRKVKLEGTAHTIADWKKPVVEVRSVKSAE